MILPSWSTDVTIRQLVHHTSGIPDFFDLLAVDGTPPTEPADDTDVLRVLDTVTELDFTPGSQWAYSNTNYVLLGWIVEDVTGTDFAAFVAAEIFEPADITAVVDPAGAVADRATSYNLWGYTATGRTWRDADSPWTFDGPGGVQTTPSDLVRWASQYWAPTVGPTDINDTRLDDAVDTGNGDRYGFGIFESEVDGFTSDGKYAHLNGVSALAHEGGWEGFVTGFLVAADLRTAVATTCTSVEVVPLVPAGWLPLEILSYWI
jgi:CubicO group peptidase (beta-lactamase class C family)